MEEVTYTLKEEIEDEVESDEHVEWSAEHGGSNALINHFKVDRCKRGQGIGSTFFQEIEEALVEYGINSVVVHMRGGDSTVSFLESMGYEIYNRENGGDYVSAQKDGLDDNEL